MQGGPSLPLRPSTRRALIVAATAVLLASAAPGALGESEAVFPPKETGVGHGDVDDEPSTQADRGTPGNHFPNMAFEPGQPSLVLDAYYLYEAFPALDVDINNMIQELGERTGFATDEQHMYLGFGTFEAWWGWWMDRGEGARMRDADNQGASNLPGASAEQNGAIEDAHDDDSRWDGDRQNGAWDEFVWRGDNPWAADHPLERFNVDEGPMKSHPQDKMKLFWDPGTHAQNARQPPIPTNQNSGYYLRNDRDAKDVPDMTFTDNTDQAPYAAPGNAQDGGWDLENRRTTGTDDDGMLVTSKITVTVTPKSKSGAAFDRLSGEAYDVDVYTAVRPEVERLYRTAVWDPHDQEDTATDTVHEEGPKQLVHDQFTELWLTADDTAIDVADAGLQPAGPAAGAADDAAGKKAWRHEPNRPADEYGVNFGGASHGPQTTYGMLSGSSDDYYEPEGQTYEGYKSGEQAWLDTQAGWGIPLYLFNFNMFGTLNLRTVQSAGGLAGGDDPGGSPPGILGVSAHFGTWFDASKDTWVGDVDEDGRWSSESDPYNGGLGDPGDGPDDPFYQARGDDPNDYRDTPERTKRDPQKSEPAEWRPLCEGSSVQATLVPRTNGQQWGTAGVYVVHDSADRGNPYDDVVTDALGVAGDEGEQLSRYVRSGPIDVTLECRDADTGLWFGDKWIVSPAGTADYPIEVRTTATVGSDRIQEHGGSANLNGDQVLDVDVLGSLNGD
jgi:hypothetical protein